jgi:hypothetical protein
MAVSAVGILDTDITALDTTGIAISGIAISAIATSAIATMATTVIAATGTITGMASSASRGGFITGTIGITIIIIEPCSRA